MADLPDEATRYPYRTVAKEIERALDAGPIGTKKRCAQAAGLSPDGLRNRIVARPGYRFAVDEIGAIAKELGAPTGWPFVPWDEAERLDKLRELLAQTNRFRPK